MPQQPPVGNRMYRDVADRLIADISSGIHRTGERLPGERDLALRYGVSRGTVREAVIVLEVLGYVEVRMGSGAHVLCVDDDRGLQQPAMTAFEVAEALLMIEGEAAALAAHAVEASELSEMAALIHRLGRRGMRRARAEALHRDFHLAVAKASRNQAIQEMVERLWEWREASRSGPKVAERMQSVQPLISEMEAVLNALMAREPETARSAMRAHLSGVLDWIVLKAEEAAVTEARRTTAERRARYLAASA